MAFDHLLFKPMTESELATTVANEFHRQYFAYGHLHFFMKLEPCENQKSQIVWIKIFTDAEALENFFFDTEYQRAMIYAEPGEHEETEEKVFKVQLFGFNITHESYVYPDKVEQFREYEAGCNIEEQPMPSRTEVKQMMDSLIGAITGKPRKRAG